jgi:hypothetical protein
MFKNSGNVDYHFVQFLMKILIVENPFLISRISTEFQPRLYIY